MVDTSFVDVLYIEIMDEVETSEEAEFERVLAEIDDPEVVQIAKTDPQARDLILAALTYANDTTSLKTLRHLMSDQNVNDRTRLDAVATWYTHRREMKKIDQIGKSVANGFSVQFTFGTQEEMDNVKRARSAFGIKDAEDATIADDE